MDTIQQIISVTYQQLQLKLQLDISKVKCSKFEVSVADWRKTAAA